MIGLIIFAFIVAAGWFGSNALARFIPRQRKAKFQFSLFDALVATLVYGCIITFVYFDIDPRTVDFSDRMPALGIIILLLQAMGFWIIQDVMCSMQPKPGWLRRMCLIGAFQIVFLYGFIILFPTWVRWQAISKS